MICTGRESIEIYVNRKGILKIGSIFGDSFFFCRILWFKTGSGWTTQFNCERVGLEKVKNMWKNRQGIAKESLQNGTTNGL